MHFTKYYFFLKRNCLIKCDLLFLILSIFSLCFHRRTESPSAIHRIKGTLFHWIPTFWTGYWINRLVSQCLFHSGSLFTLWSHVQHTVHSAIPPHCRVPQRRRGECNVSRSIRFISVCVCSTCFGGKLDRNGEQLLILISNY